jgi:hypothetical protein
MRYGGDMVRCVAGLAIVASVACSNGGGAFDGSCVPDCSATRCGPDPVCGVSCGDCPRVATLESHFDSGIEGWMLEGYATDSPNWMLTNPPTAVPKFDPTGGNRGGALYRDDEIIGSAEYFVAPASWLGARDGYAGGKLRFLLRQDDTLHPFYGPLAMLGGARETLLFDGGAPGVAFTPFEVPLSAPGWRRFSDGLPATDADLRAILADLRALRIRGEFSNSIDKSWMDDVTLSGP